VWRSHQMLYPITQGGISMSNMDRRDFMKSTSGVIAATAATALTANTSIAQEPRYPSNALKTGNIYEVYALAYFEGKRTKLAQALYQQSWDQDLTLNFYIWAAINKKNGEVTLIDTGCADELGARFRKANEPGAKYTHPKVLVTRLDIKPEQVTRVVLTHLHPDHVNGMLDFPTLYPKAQFYLQKREFDFWAFDPMSQRPPFKQNFNKPGFDAVAALAKTPRLTILDGDQFVGPEMEVLLCPGHTPGLMVVEVPTAKGQVIVASDLGHIFRTFSEDRPSNVITDIRPWMDSLDKLRPRAPLENIFPGHDILMATNFPKVREGVTQLA
jgi:glyoxylase-like metal-dependent hydrolase (beta-lactamase superfamily II)